VIAATTQAGVGGRLGRVLKIEFAAAVARRNDDKRQPVAAAIGQSLATDRV